jgi:hypothetical protein
MIPAPEGLFARSSFSGDFFFRFEDASSAANRAASFSFRSFFNSSFSCCTCSFVYGGFFT